MTTLGYRLNNPGNLRDFGITWKGKIGAQAGFCQFDTMENGVRACARNVHTLWIKYKTIREIISTYAPPSENNTEAYIKAIVAATGVAEDAPIDLNDHSFLFNWLRMQFRQEIGADAVEIADDVIRAGIIDALGE
jgi:glucokinase